ncbi:MAG: uncharacterized protein JWP63_38 [Candidatus Solibacter sp.]|jgi:hypothetical protein|nr:uncharacterized protein [Candidatus Solibacter sp.]
MKRDDGEHLARVRRICLALPATVEKISHGEPTFFAGKVYAMFSNNHHNDGHVALCVPAAPGVQEALIAASPKTYYRPPYVGVRGWVGIELAEIDDDELAAHILNAWRIIAPKKLQSARR